VGPVRPRKVRKGEPVVQRQMSGGNDTKLKRNRRSIRIPDFDYAGSGAYFVTICTRGGRCVLGEVPGERVELGRIGRIVQRQIERTMQLRENVTLDEYCIMPNHVHAILWLDSRGTARRAPTAERFGRPVAGSLSTIVRALKSAVTREVNQTIQRPGRRFWQRGYYEHVIRTQGDLFRHRKYVLENPLKWHFDKENPTVRPC